MKVKTNTGRIYVIDYVAEEKEEQVYSEYVYATCEKHAIQIFESVNEQCKVLKCEEQAVCISQHYGDDEGKAVGTVIPEHELAEKIIFSALETIRKDRKVTEDNIDYVLDLALTMTRNAIKKACSKI